MVGGADADGGPPYVGKLAGWAADRYGREPAQRYRLDGRWIERSYADLGALVRQAATGLRTLGLGRGDRIALLAGTRPAGTVLDAVARQRTVRRGDVIYLHLPLASVFARTVQLAALQAGATLVYPAAGTLSVAELAEVRPTGLPSTPRLYEKVYAAATAGIP